MGFLLAVILSPVPQDVPPKPADLFERVAAALKDKPVVEFESEMTTRIQSVTVVQRTKVILKRPNLARLEVSGLGQDAWIVFDGSHSWHFLKARNRYVRSKQLGTAKLDQYGAGPAAALFFQGGMDAFKPYLGTATISKDSLGGRDCFVVAWSVGAEKVAVWIEGARLVQVRYTRSRTDQESEQTIRFGEMRFPTETGATLFEFRPPEGSEPLATVGEERLLNPGTNIPDVAGLDLLGKPLRLSAYKGRPLVVTFWFYG